MPFMLIFAHPAVFVLIVIMVMSVLLASGSDRTDLV